MMTDIGKKTILNLATVFNLTETDLRMTCRDAMAAGVSGIMMMPAHIQASAPEASGLSLIAVSGYPAGIQPIESKAVEISQAYTLGANEVFAAAHNGFVMDGDAQMMEREMRGFAEAANGRSFTLLIELAVLNREQLKRLCSCAQECGIISFGTSAGFLYNSIFSITHPEELARHVCTTEPENVFELRKLLGAEAEIVAVDCKMDVGKAKMLLEAGADRLCAAKAIEIVRG